MNEDWFEHHHRRLLRDDDRSTGGIAAAWDNTLQTARSETGTTNDQVLQITQLPLHTRAHTGSAASGGGASTSA
jgi:hypothetical protein